MICLFMKSNMALKNVIVTSAHTEGLNMKFVTEPKGNTQGTKLSWEAIAAEEQVTILGNVNFSKPTPSSSLVFSGQVVYHLESSDDEKTLDFEIPFNFVEMIRGTPMSSSEYFALWKSSKADRRVEVKTTLRNTRLFAEKANRLFHVALIDVNDEGRKNGEGVMLSTHILASWKDSWHAFDMSNGSKHDLNRMYDLLQDLLFCSLQITS